MSSWRIPRRSDTFCLIWSEGDGEGVGEFGHPACGETAEEEMDHDGCCARSMTHTTVYVLGVPRVMQSTPVEEMFFRILPKTWFFGTPFGVLSMTDPVTPEDPA